MIPFWQALVLLGACMIFGLSMGVLVAYVYFRASKGSEGTFFGESKGEVFSIDNFGEEEEEVEPILKIVSNKTKGYSNRFLEQFSNKLGEDKDEGA